MLLAEAVYVFVGFILASGTQEQSNCFCALKGSSVDLPCSAQHHTSSMKWFTRQWKGSDTVYSELSADGNHVKYNMSEEIHPTLTIENVTESDTNMTYCCTETVKDTQNCSKSGFHLHLTDLQVKVIPATEGQTVSLICSSSCTLTENPAAYIWYKNREFLYQDWSPWYQQLVSSEEAVRYSCAVKGYEHLRAPEVSVDSVTSTCFTVTYADRRMCPNNQALDKLCSITYPREVHIQKTVRDSKYYTLTCATSCPTTDPHTAYRFYERGSHSYSTCGSQAITVLNSAYTRISCSIRGSDDLRSTEICINARSCWTIVYDQRRVCALEGTSVNISADNPWGYRYHAWNKIETGGNKPAESVIKEHWIESHNGDLFTLTINNLQRNDSADYVLIETGSEYCNSCDLPGVTLVVTGLRVTFKPSAVVTEAQRVTLTCSTSCPLTDTVYIWYLNSRRLTEPESQDKHLVLDPVTIQHAGNYSCAVNVSQFISSSEKALTVRPREKSIVIMNAVKLIFFGLVLSAVLLYLWMRKKKTMTPAGDTANTEQTYESISLRAVNPAARRKPAEQQEDTL